jgi:cytochrome c556
MTRLSILVGALAAFALPAAAAEDPVAVRKALMSSMGAQAAVAAGVQRGEITYSPAVGRATIAAAAATAQAYADFFPEGSDGDERSAAAPRIWEDRAGFEAEVAKLQAAVAAAVAASGRDGPPDAGAFTAAMGPVLETCRTCHESYRIDP